jgi:hypothetical protein
MSAWPRQLAAQFKADGGQVMAFVDDDIAVFGDHIRHDALART